MSAVLSSTPYRALTEKIIEAMKGNPQAYKMPWHTGDQPGQLPMNASTDAPYRGVNVLSLWISAMQGRYPSGYWASYKQWQSLGAQVRRGERGSQIVFYKPLVPGEGETAGDAETPRFVIRTSHVFNSAQVEGWTAPALPVDAGREPERGR